MTVRFFAAAAAAAGADTETVQLPAKASIADLETLLASRGPELKRVLARCSYLRDGVAVRDRGSELPEGTIVDVLPPFAGG